MKICSKCKAEKSKTEFSKDNRSSSGVQSRCKSCVAEYYIENSDRILSRVRAYKESNPERVAACQKAYRISNPEKLAACERRCRQSNPERVAEYQRAYREEHPDKISSHKRNRRARVRNAEGRHTGADVKAIFEMQRGLCASCAKKLIKSGENIFHVDHIMPLALGGSNWPANLQCLCPSCNLRKRAKHPSDWAKQNGKLL